MIMILVAGSGKDPDKNVKGMWRAEEEKVQKNCRPFHETHLDA